MVEARLGAAIERDVAGGLSDAWNTKAVHSNAAKLHSSRDTVATAATLVFLTARTIIYCLWRSA